MSVNTVTTTNVIYDAESSDGRQHGLAASSKQSFYGATPVAQPSGAAQAAITDASGGSASPTTGVQALTSSYNSTLIANALATIIAQGAAIRSALVSVGLMKGSS
jgi:hypothetical protein